MLRKADIWAMSTITTCCSRASATISNGWRTDSMFGLDLLFDLDKNGKLDAFERAAEMAFLDIVDSSLQTGKS